VLNEEMPFLTENINSIPIITPFEIGR